MKPFLSLIKKPMISISLIIAAVILPYSNIFHNDFVGDDPGFIIGWELTHSWRNIPELLAGAVPLGHEQMYRPVRSLIYLAMYQAFGSQLWAYHAFSLIVHLAVTFLVYALSLKIFKSKALALVAALLFATHPIHTDAITFMASSFDIVGIVFMLASFWFYLKARHPGDLTASQDDRISSEMPAKPHRQSNRDPIVSMSTSRLQDDTSAFLSVVSRQLSIVLAVLAFFTYEMTLVLPLLILWYEWYLGYSPKTKQASFHRTKIYWALAAVYVLVRVGLLHIVGRGDYQADSFWLTQMVTVKVFFKYLQLMIWPVGLSLNHILPTNIHTYTMEAFNDPAIRAQRWTELGFLLPVIVFSALTWFGLKAAREQPLITFSLGWMGIALLPVSNLVPNSCLLCERYTYLSSVGFVWLLLSCSLVLLQKTKRIKKQDVFPVLRIPYSVLRWFPFLLIGAVVLGYAYLTYNRNQDWRSEITIWAKTVQQAPNSTVYYKLGSAYFANQQYPEAAQALEQALTLSPNFAQVWFNRGRVYEEQGDEAQAIAHYRQALVYKQDLWQVPVRLGDIHTRHQRYDQAIEAYQQALSIPASDNPRSNLLRLIGHTYNLWGTQLVADGDFSAALQYYQLALEADPQSLNVLNNLGSLFGRQGDYQQAEHYFRRALEIDPAFEEAQRNLDKLENLRRPSIVPE